MLEGQHSPQPLVPAQLTGLGAAPATAIAPPALPAVPVTPSTTTLPAADLDARPVYAPIDGLRDSPPAADSPYLVHVVQNGDSLEQLAERYLGDGARALELFDVNRDVLENPHLLPLGAELRIPRAAAARE
jgi:nucleoid-associated protein YgaU